MNDKEASARLSDRSRRQEELAAARSATSVEAMIAHRQLADLHAAPDRTRPPGPVADEQGQR